MEHCKACGEEITRTRINKLSGENEDLCSYCLSIALQAAWDLDLAEDPDDVIDTLSELYGGER